jgi:hypothetical protein
MRLNTREAIKEAVAANLGFGIVWATEVEWPAPLIRGQA